jgi:hypothetical protein
VGTLLVMTKKSYKKKSEVAHHGSKATSEDVTTTFEGLLTGLAGRNRGGHVTYV